MLNEESLASYSSQLESDSFDTLGEPGIQQRLGLYQIFLKLYEHHPSLLEEILSLETGASNGLTGMTMPYVQATRLGEQVCLITNLLKGRSQALYQPQQIWTIGRDAQQSLLPIADRRLSRRHGAIRYQQGQFYLIDLDSSNGSFINGELIRQWAVLKDGDRIRLGSITFTFYICQSTQTLKSISATMLDRCTIIPTLPKGYGLSSDRCPALATRTIAGNGAATIYDDTLLFLRSGTV
ncbi:MAG: FHA domain-containing protein [Leptolyngbyaceae cyanobacterium SL_7_1]|nr:FHA domain-containing protein [Leptolyngbyaceae cyanobacterium SL_7_1]